MKLYLVYEKKYETVEFVDYLDEDTVVHYRLVGIFKNLNNARKLVKEKYGVPKPTPYGCAPIDSNRYICINEAEMDLI